jgi:hypothetical protein
MTVPSPGEFDASVRAIIEQAQRIRIEYRWNHGAAFDRAVGDQAKVQVSSPNDPTGELATDKSRSAMRKQMYRAADAIEKALDELAVATGALKAGAARDPGGIRFEALRNPRSATRADLAESAAAAERRAERGESIP